MLEGRPTDQYRMDPLGQPGVHQDFWRATRQTYLVVVQSGCVYQGQLGDCADDLQLRSFILLVSTSSGLSSPISILRISESFRSAAAYLRRLQPDLEHRKKLLGRNFLGEAEPGRAG